MRITVEINDRTYARLRTRAAQRGMRGFSQLVEEALNALLDRSVGGELDSPLAAAEGAWSEADAQEWESARKEAWATRPSSRSRAQTS